MMSHRIVLGRNGNPEGDSQPLLPGWFRPVGA